MKNKKQKNKNKIIIIASIILVVLLCIILAFIKNNKTKPTTEPDQIKVLFNIKSTKENPIKQGDIEVENIDVVEKNQQTRVIFTIRNTSKKKVEGTFICFELLDENREFVTVISKNIQWYKYS